MEKENGKTSLKNKKKAVATVDSGFDQDKAIVVKSNALIEASYRLSLQEQRLVLILASMIKRSDKDFKIYRLTLQEFCERVGIKNNNRIGDQIQQVCNSLESRELIIHKHKSVLITRWMASAEYFPEHGVIELEFSSKLKPYLLDLKKRFTPYGLAEVIQLRSIYSIRMFELMREYENVGERVMRLESLRKTLGIEDDEYKLYGHFKTKVLEVARAELDRLTDITFTYEEQKAGRKVVALKFIIKRKRRQIQEKVARAREEPISPSELEKLMELVPEKHRTPAVGRIAKEALGQYGIDYVMRNIDYTNKHFKTSYRPYLIGALANDWAVADHEEAENAKQLTFESARQQKMAELREQQEIEAAHDRAREYLGTLSEAELGKIKLAALKGLYPAETVRAAQKDGTWPSSIEAAMVGYVLSKKLVK